MYKRKILFILTGVFLLYFTNNILFSQNKEEILKDFQEPAEDEKQVQNEKDVGNEIVERENREEEADQLILNAQKAYSDDKFQKSVQLYLKAIGKLRECNETALEIQRKIKACEIAISKSCYYWAINLAEEAKKDDNVKKYSKAIQKLRDGIQIYPQSKEMMENKISEYKDLRKKSQFKQTSSPEKTMPDKKEEDYRIEVLFKQGVELYEDRQFDKAREKFESIIVLDPYNVDTIDYIRKLNEKFIETAEERYKATRSERNAEAYWKSVSPLIPRALKGAQPEAFQPLSRSLEKSPLEQKLEDIVITQIEFDDVSVETVIKYLRERSKELDPEKEGINFVLRLKPVSGENEDREAEQTQDNQGEEDFFAEEDDDAGGEFFDEGLDEDETIDESPDTGIPNITMIVDEIPLIDAIKYICNSANLKYRIEDYAVVIAGKNVRLEEVETKIFAIEQETISDIGFEGDPAAVKTFFEDRGVEFPAGSQVVYDARISRLIATNTRENLKQVADIIREINVVDPQVLIEVKFVEVAQNDLNELGFEWLYRKSIPDATLGPSSEGVIRDSIHSSAIEQNSSIMRNVEDTGIGDIPAGARPDEVLNIIGWDSEDYDSGDPFSFGQRFQAILHALDQSDSGDILSTPRVTVMNGEEAVIRMVTEVYYPESWTDMVIASGEAQIGYVSSVPEFGEPTEDGIRLVVTPNVDPDNRTVSLEMKPEIQKMIGWTDYSIEFDVDGDGTITHFPDGTVEGNTIKMPIIQYRTVSTSISLFDGETIVLGGTVRDRTSTFDDKVPIAGDVPIVGRMFTSKAQRSEKVNLLIFVTVRLIYPDGSPIRAREMYGVPAFRQ